MTLRTEKRVEHCQHCGADVFGLKLGIGGGRYYDAEPTTDPSTEQHVYELAEREIAGASTATMAIHDRPTSRRLREQGTALYAEHGCDRREPVEAGPHTPWTTA